MTFPLCLFPTLFPVSCLGLAFPSHVPFLILAHVKLLFPIKAPQSNCTSFHMEKWTHSLTTNRMWRMGRPLVWLYDDLFPLRCPNMRTLSGPSERRGVGRPNGASSGVLQVSHVHTPYFHTPLI